MVEYKMPSNNWTRPKHEARYFENIPEYAIWCEGTMRYDNIPREGRGDVEEWAWRRGGVFLRKRRGTGLKLSRLIGGRRLESPGKGCLMRCGMTELSGVVVRAAATNG
jgi:hypothetical protein